MPDLETGTDEFGDYTVIWSPQPKQAAFISCPADDVGFGGARGGGKSDAVVGDWGSHEEMYGTSAIGMAFRRERTQLTELIERAKQVLIPIGHKWHEQDKYFRGPKGGRLRFSYLESDSDADAYQGHSYTRLYPEEMGTFPTETPINKLNATLRSGNGVPCQMKGTCNPGGPGHQWVKARYNLAGRPQEIIRQDFEFTNPFTGRNIPKTRIFIPSRLGDNRFLGDAYAANIAQSGSAALVKAWLEGDWDVIEGAYFDQWRLDKHVIAPFAIPSHWIRFVSMDWGFASPFSVGWWAVVSEPVSISGLARGVASVGQGNGSARNGVSDGSAFGAPVLPRGCLVRYREWYGRGGARLTAEQIATGILEREHLSGEKRNIEAMENSRETSITYGVLDPSSFATDGGPSIAERMARAGVMMRKADNRRVKIGGAIGGWDQMRERLSGDADGNPMVVTFSTCVDSIRTIPVLQHDPDRPEDLDTTAEDHAADDWRYACMSRPWVRQLPTVPEKKILGIGPHNTVTLDDLWETAAPVAERI